jgi:hypothetical protein
MPYPVFDELDFIMKRFGKKPLTTQKQPTMENKTLISNSLILQAHKEACPKWKGIIEKECPSLFPKYKVGDWIHINDGGGHNANHKWYKYENCVKKGQVHRIDDIDMGQCQEINNAVSINGTAYRVSYIDRLATKEEITEHLTKVSVEKGFVKGVKIKSPFSGIEDIIDGEFHMNDLDLCVFCKTQSLLVFDSENGKWATILEEPKEVIVTMDEIAKLKGVDVSLIKIVK